MSQIGRTNLFKEKMILQEEEISLKKMLDKFQDQLHRLKVEELALLHLMRMEKGKESKVHPNGDCNQASQTIASGINKQSVDDASDLKPTYPQGNMFSDSDGDDDEESLPSDMVPIGFMQRRFGNESADDINKEALNLEVPQAPGTSYSNSLFLSDNDEEEEEESDEMDNDDAESDSGEGKLRTFIDG